MDYEMTTTTERLINIVNYTAANCGSIPAIVQTSVLTNETAIPFYYIAYDLTTNGLGSGLNLQGSPLIFSTEAAAGTASLYCDVFLLYSCVAVARGPGDVKLNTKFLN